VKNANSQARQPGRSGFIKPEGRLNRAGGRRQGDRRSPDSSPPAYRLKRSVDVFPATDGTLYLLRSGAGDEFAIKGSGFDHALLENLAKGYATAPELSAALGSSDHDGSDIVTTLAMLENHGLLERRRPALLGATDAERYDRQLIYFSDLAGPGRSSEELQQRLLAARVVLLGCGGLGSWTACGLACAGVGSLVLIDDDEVELSNLNRQLLFTESDLGQPKVDVGAQALKRHNSELQVDVARRRVKGPADLGDLLEGADLLIATADWPPHQLPRWINQACLRAEVPYITAGQFPPLVRVGPMVLPGRSACLECLERQTRRDYPLYDELAAHRARHPTTAATVGAVSGIVGSMLAMEAIHLLVGNDRPASVNTALIMDLRTMTIAGEPVSRDPDCPLCSQPQGPTRRT
jgi:bacteriocin biosynthesis cyclodehydratase domain-containing protein